jgi:hypothetical protein
MMKKLFIAALIFMFGGGNQTLCAKSNIDHAKPKSSRWKKIKKVTAVVAGVFLLNTLAGFAFDQVLALSGGMSFKDSIKNRFINTPPSSCKNHFRYHLEGISMGVVQLNIIHWLGLGIAIHSQFFDP